ncbi:MAG: flagellar basal body rod protein FlgB [Actinobacteria bacterium]|nr:flagellar basal body rod protein FlgB [Actinomycetota bacterium]
MSDIMQVLGFALQGMTQRQQAIAGNLSNVDTPGYTAQQVHFQSSLESAMSGQGPQSASITESASPRLPTTNGNNVDVGSQMVDAVQATMQYQALVDMFNAQYRLVQGAAGGSFQ